MRRKISQSIQAKTFLSMLALLVVCCIIIYGMVMIFLPRNYHTELEGQVTSDFMTWWRFWSGMAGRPVRTV